MQKMYININKGIAFLEERTFEILQPTKKLSQDKELKMDKLWYKIAQQPFMCRDSH